METSLPIPQWGTQTGY